MSYEVDVLHNDKHESLLQVDNTSIDGFWQTYPKFPGKFAISSWHHKKEVRNEIRDLLALAGSNTALTSYYTSNALPPLTLFLSQYEIHTNPFLHLINCLCNISSLLLFQVTVGPYKILVFVDFHRIIQLFSSTIFGKKPRHKCLTGF